MEGGWRIYKQWHRPDYRIRRLIEHSEVVAAIQTPRLSWFEDSRCLAHNNRRPRRRRKPVISPDEAALGPNGKQEFDWEPTGRWHQQRTPHIHEVLMNNRRQRLDKIKTKDTWTPQVPTIEGSRVAEEVVHTINEIKARILLSRKNTELQLMKFEKPKNFPYKTLLLDPIPKHRQEPVKHRYDSSNNIKRPAKVGKDFGKGVVASQLVEKIVGKRRVAKNPKGLVMKGSNKYIWSFNDKDKRGEIELPDINARYWLTTRDKHSGNEDHDNYDVTTARDDVTELEDEDVGNYDASGSDDVIFGDASGAVVTGEGKKQQLLVKLPRISYEYTDYDLYQSTSSSGSVEYLEP